MFRNNAVPFIPVDVRLVQKDNKLFLDYDQNQNKQAETADRPQIHRSMNVS